MVWLEGCEPHLVLSVVPPRGSNWRQGLGRVIVSWGGVDLEEIKIALA